MVFPTRVNEKAQSGNRSQSDKISCYVMSLIVFLVSGSNQEPVDQEAVHNNAGLVNNPDSVVESLLKIRGLVSGLLFDENGELSTG